MTSEPDEQNEEFCDDCGGRRRWQWKSKWWRWKIWKMKASTIVDVVTAISLTVGIVVSLDLTVGTVMSLGVILL